MPYYIGVDGGGTKTAYALFNEEKELLLLQEGPGSNHENLEGSFDQAAQLLWEGLHGLVSEANLTLPDVDFTLMGLAGIDHPFQYHAMMQRLNKRGLEKLEICNDGFIVVKAGSRSGAAIGYNCGTGTCCNAIDRDGRMVQLAGLGDFSGDVGNGQWIGVTAFRLVYDDCILGVAPTRLTALFLEEFGLHDGKQIPLLLAALDGEEAADTLKAMIRLFFQAAAEGDGPVLAAVETMAQRGAQLIAAHVRNLNFAGDPVEVVLSGSIHTKLPNKVYLDRLKQKAAVLSGRPLDFHILNQPPVMGCIQWILQDYAKG
ncbi:MAG: hypothetical protein LBJ11_02290 [Oscillospiraceae bacterium]|jgi:N-acetylglucosamine kinase-like BadF-type ATPase|nr:hypothetical protein [Oscillospiraceae bacterium]